MIPLAVFRREAEGALKRARNQDEHQLLIEAIKRLEEPPWKRPRRLPLKIRQVAKRYMQQVKKPPEPTTLVMVDEADRLKTAGLEQVCDIFDQGGMVVYV